MLGGKIKQFRKEHNYSQRELAQLIDVSSRSVGRWEQNKAKPNVEELSKLSRIMGISESELLREDEEERNSPLGNTLDRIVDSVDNLVTGQDTINKTIESGQAEFRKHQEELISELRKQNDDLTRRLEESEKKNDYQKEILKQKKIRNVILVIFLLIVIGLIGFFLWYLLSNGIDSKRIYFDQTEIYTN